MSTKPKVSKSAARAEGAARTATKKATRKAAKRPAKSTKTAAAQRSRTVAVGGGVGEVIVTIPLDSLPVENAAQAKDEAKAGKVAKAPTAAREVEVLGEDEARDRGGMTEIIKTLKGKDAAVRQAAKAGGFVIEHEDGRYSAARTAEPAEASADAPEPQRPAKPKPSAAAKSAGVKGGKGAKQPKAPKERQPKQMSAIDAAAQVLAKAKKPMRAKELIEAMAKQGLWSSPAGKTPEATLYAAMVREISKKGKEARFRKHDRGAFVATGKGA